MKDLGILSSKLFFFVWTSLRKARQGVCSSISLALVVINLEVVLRELLSSSDLMRTQAFCIHEPTQDGRLARELRAYSLPGSASKS